MSNGRKYFLKDLSSIRLGYALRGSLEEDPNGEALILQMKDLSLEGIEWNSLARFQPSGRKSPDYLHRNDVVFCGRGTRIFGRAVGEHPENVVAGPQFFVLTPTEDCPAEYLAWYINSKMGQRYFWRYAGGSSIINVTRNVLENCPIILPESGTMETMVQLIHSHERERRVMQDLTEKRQRLLEAVIDTSLEER